MSPYTMKRRTTLLSAMSFPLNLSTFICPETGHGPIIICCRDLMGKIWGDERDKRLHIPKEKRVFPASSQEGSVFLYRPCGKPNVVSNRWEMEARRGSRPSPDRRYSIRLPVLLIDPVPPALPPALLPGSLQFRGAICRPKRPAPGRPDDKAAEAPPK